jgi:hypothetical protein
LTRFLNDVIALIQFIPDDDQHWLFSRLGTHLPENLLGFVGRNSHGDDQRGLFYEILARVTMVYQVADEMGIAIKPLGRDNVGRIVINSAECTFDEGIHELVFGSFLDDNHFTFTPVPLAGVFSLVSLKSVFRACFRKNYRPNDPVHDCDFAPVSNCRIIVSTIIDSAG